MIINFLEVQLNKFDTLAKRIQNNPEEYIDFDSVSDFYKVKWLSEFPKGTIWTATGLDDGAEEFYALIEYKNHFLKIHQTPELSVTFGIHHDHEKL